MLYSQLMFLTSLVYLWLYIQFSIYQDPYESHGREGDMFWAVCEEMALFYNVKIWQRLQKDM